MAKGKLKSNRRVRKWLGDYLREQDKEMTTNDIYKAWVEHYPWSSTMYMPMNKLAALLSSNKYVEVVHRGQASDKTTWKARDIEGQTYFANGKKSNVIWLAINIDVHLVKVKK